MRCDLIGTVDMPRPRRIMEEYVVGGNGGRTIQTRHTSGHTVAMGTKPKEREGGYDKEEG